MFSPGAAEARSTEGNPSPSVFGLAPVSRPQIVSFYAGPDVPSGSGGDWARSRGSDGPDRRAGRAILSIVIAKPSENPAAEPPAFAFSALNYARFRVTLRALGPARLPPHQGSMLRSFVLEAPCAPCVLRRECPYPRIFETTIVEAPAGGFLDGFRTLRGRMSSSRAGRRRRWRRVTCCRSICSCSVGRSSCNAMRWRRSSGWRVSGGGGAD